MAGDTTGLEFADLLNTGKALSVILGIFLSVAIAFFFGTVVQFVSRTIFSFNYKSNLKWKIGLFGGICATAIVYFLLIKGAKGLSFMTPEVAAWIDGNTALIIGGCLLCFYPADAAAPHTGSECAQSDSAYGHVLACHGLCRKRPCELYRSAAFSVLVVVS